MRGSRTFLYPLEPDSNGCSRSKSRACGKAVALLPADAALKIRSPRQSHGILLARRLLLKVESFCSNFVREIRTSGAVVTERQRQGQRPCSPRESLCSSNPPLARIC